MVVATAGASLGVAIGCGDSNDPADSEFLYGEPVAVGAGQARSYVLLDQGRPLEFVVAISEDALTDLPATAMMYQYLLPLPATNPTPIRLVELDWNPMGHPPPPSRYIVSWDGAAREWRVALTSLVETTQ
jgi:hypothetical protein